MANVYVRSGAAGAGTGADWANAYTTLAAALTAKAAGDDFWVSEDHAESQAGAMTLTSPGTGANPCRIVCVNHAGSVPPVSADLATTATVTSTGGVITYGGTAHARGILFSCLDHDWQTTSTCSWMHESCGLTVTGAGAARFLIGGVGQNYGCRFRNCTFTTVAASTFALRSGVFDIRGGSIAGTAPTTLVTLSATGSGRLLFSGVDLSLLGSGKTLVSWATAGDVQLISFINCKLGASVAMSTGSFPAASLAAGPIMRLVNCDSANSNYRYYYEDFRGSIRQETTIVRSGGASDGTTPISRKMVSTANSKFYSPLESDPIEFWNESTSAVTVTVPVITDNVTLKNNDAWIEVEYPGNASFPISTFDLSNRAADVLNAGSNQATDGTSSWTTTGLGTPVKQSLTATFTPAAKGVIRVKVCLAKASTTMYFDPTVGISSAAQYMLGEGFINDPDDPTQSAVTSGTKYNQNRSTGSASAARVLESASLNGGLI